jgi:hypothetical protein
MQDLHLIRLEADDHLFESTYGISFPRLMLLHGSIQSVTLSTLFGEE